MTARPRGYDAREPAPAGHVTRGATVADEKGKGSKTARKANAKASKEGKSNPRKSSAAQAELGKKGGKTQKKD